VTNAPLAEQTIIAHLFASLDSAHADIATRYLKRRWQRFRKLAATTEPITETGLPTSFPAVVPTGSSVLIAAQQDAKKHVQLVLRREHDILTLSVRLGPRPGTTWDDQAASLDDLLGMPPDGTLIGLVRMYVARVADEPTEYGRTLRDVLPPPQPADGWWHQPYTGDTFAMWDTASAHENTITRTLVLLTRPDPRRFLGHWIWAPGGHAHLPPLARYLMHVAKIRYQHRIWSTWRAGADLQGEEDPGRLIHDLGALRMAVEGSWRNAMAALAPVVADPNADDPFATDANHTAWLARELDREITRVETYMTNAQRWSDTENRSVERSSPAALADRAHALVDRAAVVHLAVDHAAVTHPPARCLLVLATEWSPRSPEAVVNRHLCRALASAGATVHCLVPSATPDDRRDAEDAGVVLVEARPYPGASARQSLSRPPDLPDGVVPDAVIGHGLETGPAARTQVANYHHGTPWLLVVLARPHETDRQELAEYENPASAETRATELLALGRTATRVLAVGPKVHAWLDRDLPVRQDGPFPSRIDPGFGDADQETRSFPRGTPQILIVSDIDDVHAKGVDIAAKSIARAAELSPGKPAWDVLIRGAPESRRAEFAETVGLWLPPDAVTVRIGDDAPGLARLAADLSRSSLVLVPSRFEDFGVAGAEAIAAGVPVLASERGGLGQLVRNLSPEEAQWFTPPVDGQDDIETWAHRIFATLDDRAGAFDRAERLRQSLAKRGNWRDAAAAVLNAIPDRYR